MVSQQSRDELLLCLFMSETLLRVSEKVRCCSAELFAVAVPFFTPEHLNHSMYWYFLT
jgi:hypothetical protein